MSNSQDVTAAQEIITIAMLGALLMCGILNYALLTLLHITSIPGYIALTIGTFVIAGYLVPNLVAYWLGRPLDDILDDETSVEATLDTEYPSE